MGISPEWRPEKYQHLGFRQRLATEKEIIALLLANPATSPKA
jgi:hypothetical protein